LASFPKVEHITRIGNFFVGRCGSVHLNRILTEDIGHQTSERLAQTNDCDVLRTGPETSESQGACAALSER